MSANLTREETAARAAAIEISAQEVTVDLRDARDLHQPTYPVRSLLRIKSDVAETWVDYIASAVTVVAIDGKQQPVVYDGARIQISGLPVGVECEVVIEGASLYSRSGEGMHRFQDPADGEVYLYTQYEPSDARRVFPCFEQPDMKPEFYFTVIGPESWQLLSNQPELSRQPAGEGMVCVEYAPTPRLSTFITCICAGPYHRVEDSWTSDDGRVHVPLALLCRQSLAQHLDADELFRITKAGLAYLHEAFGDYVWGKYDQIFVPEYNLGAMENPGLVTFTEHYLFRSQATPAQYQARSNTILHEMSHMWFGDLVTPRWWGDLWLKESFAEFMGAHLSKEAASFEDAWLNFTGTRKAGAYVADAMPTTHPIVADIPDLEAAKNNFDRITYSKGASALTQLVHYVGLDNFFAGCRLYFDRHAYGAASLADFLEALAQTSGKDLAQWSGQWLLTTGYDALGVRMASEAGRISTLDVTSLPADGSGVERPHATTVGLYDLVDDRLVLRQRVDVVLDRPMTEVPGVAGQALPAAVIPNDTDQTYARIALDGPTRAVLLDHLCDLEPLTRAVVWASLWEDVRDALLAPADYVDAVLAHGPAEDRAGTLTALHRNALEAVQRFVAPDERVALAARWSDAALQAAHAAEAGSAAQLQWARAHLSAASLAGVDVRGVLDGAIEGLEISSDIRWQVLQAQAEQGNVTDDEIADALAADRTAAGTTAHLRAWFSRPEPALKEEAWRRAHTVGGETNEHVTALLDALYAQGDAPLLDAFAEPYFEGLLQVWQEHPIEISRRLVVLGHPRNPDHAHLARQWLVSNPEAPGALRRLVLERHAELEITNRVRRAGAGQAIRTR